MKCWMPMLHVQAVCLCCIVHVYAAWPCCMPTLHAFAPCPGCMSMLHVHACPWFISLSPCYMSMLSCPCLHASRSCCKSILQIHSLFYISF
jgi:hypothetical protein